MPLNGTPQKILRPGPSKLFFELAIQYQQTIRVKRKDGVSDLMETPSSIVADGLY
jgi:hypothetical protein